MGLSTSGRLCLNTERSRATRKRSEEALVEFLHELGDFDPPLIVLGGLVPDMLTRDQDFPVPKHIGTTDVDMLIDFLVAGDKDLGPIEQALARIGFSPKSGNKGWRWIRSVRGVPVMLDFLCELDDEPAGHIVRPFGCKLLGAANLRGTGYVREDWHAEKMIGILPNGQSVTVEVRVAGLCGYMLAKATAVRERSEEKDYYDFAYVLIFNRLGGPAQAAYALRKGKFAGRLKAMKTVWREVADRFGAPDRAGAAGYAAQAALAEPAADGFQKRQDAVAAVKEFMKALEIF